MPVADVTADMTTDHTGLWDRRYATVGPTQVSWFSPDMHTSFDLLARAGLDASTSVVDIGGGASVLVDRLVGTGVEDVTVVDLSPTALAAAKARLDGVPAGRRVSWVCTDLFDWAPDRTWDLWHDRAVFHFLTQPQDVAAYVDLAAGAVAPGGHLVLGTFAPDGPTTCSGLPVARATPEELATVFAAHFEPVHAAAEAHLTPSGTTQSFSWVVLRRRDA